MRIFLIKNGGIMAGLLLWMLLPPVATAQHRDISLHWLWKEKAAVPTGLSWGVPFEEGTVKKDQAFSLVTAAGEVAPLQSWPMAYWPDGSLKWSGFAAVAAPGGGPLTLRLQDKTAGVPPEPVSVTNEGNRLRINTGKLACVIPRQGSILLDSITVQGRVVGGGGHLECLLQEGPAGEDYNTPAVRKFVSRIDSVSVEQNGPVRAVVRLQGKMQSGTREWLPFNLRLYFYAGSQNVKMIYTFIYDGDDRKDFIKGLGFVVSVPMQEEMYNRHVRFAGEGPGIWAEPVKPLVGRRWVMYDRQRVFPGQVKGKPVPDLDRFEPRMQLLISKFPVWNDYRLIQANAGGFNIQKRTNSESAWIDAAAGRRARGLVFAGDTHGGLAIGVKDFWQTCPTALEVRNAATDTASLRAWLWSPYGRAMDLRHYDTTAHGLIATYEDVQEGFSTPYGIAHTSVLTLFASDSVPSNARLSEESLQSAHPPLLTATPAWLHHTQALGIWSLPDSSTAGKAWIGDQLNKAIAFYQGEIDRRNWYGFWDYGDVMHSYDRVRHSWRYDIGGFAWDNTELGTVMWLWYSYLRTGRPDIYRMAEAMTRHTSEVDVYHIGRFAGLGSRHNVRHWGDGSKEVRESQASYHRFYYYLTTDERTGDIMEMVARQADLAMTRVDPLREILPKTQYPTHARFGPDWLALVGNWMVAWERTGDKKWLDNITTGINSFAKMPYGFFSGAQGAFGYDPETKKMYSLNDTLGATHLSVLMGGPEVAFELTGLMDNPTWNKLWLQYCKLYGAPQPAIIKAFGKRGNLGNRGVDFARLPAFVYKMTGDASYANRAWREFLNIRTKNQFDTTRIDGSNSLKPLVEIPRVSTNSTAQWCLNAIELLEMAGDRLPAESLLWNEQNQEGRQTAELYKVGKLLYSEDFDTNLSHWVSETPEDSRSHIGIKNQKLVVDVAKGATVWFRFPLSGNTMITYNRKVNMDNGINDRLSDLNMFWMATDPGNKNLFTRQGVFKQYDSLSMYYVGYGGNYNSTTRFRKYPGNGERTLLAEYTDPEHLLKPNKTYNIKITVFNGRTEFFIDGEKIFSYLDLHPLTHGYFGFRTTKSRHEMDDFRVYRLIAK